MIEMMEAIVEEIRQRRCIFAIPLILVLLALLFAQARLRKNYGAQSKKISRFGKNTIYNI
jgi:hypothetical protein